MTSRPDRADSGIAVARSFLFVPGHRADRFGKARDSGADQVVCDLEDAVGPDSKQAARARTVAWLASGGSACVRLNAPGTPWHEEDLAALADLPGLRGVVVPKAEDPEALAAVAERCAVPVIALVETARGLLQALSLSEVPGVARLAFGSVDFSLDIASEEEQLALLHARSSLVVASRAGGLAPPVDGVTTALEDDALLRRDAKHAASLGFGAKLCIHPRQVSAVNETFSPSPDQVAWATKVLAACPEGEVGVVDAEMVDRPVLERARGVIARHERLGR